MKKPLTTAAWSAIFGIVVAVLSGVLGATIGAETSLGLGLNTVFTVIGAILGSLFLYGFVFLGKKYNNMLLQVMAWIGIAITIGWMVLAVVFNVASVASAQEIGALTDEEAGTAFLLLFLVFWIPFSLIFGAYSVLFGVGLLKLKDKLKHAKTAAILDIVGGATLIVFIGIVIRLVGYGFEIAMMFGAARKLEKK